MTKLVFRNGEWIDKKTGNPVPHEKKWDFSRPWTGHIAADYEGYECPVTGKWIEGKAAHRENLKRTGCRVLESGEKEMNKKALEQRKERELDRAIEKSIEAVAKDFL